MTPAARPRGGAARRRLRAAWRSRPRCEVARAAGPDAVVVVLLPDSGRGYLSKIFNDEWMADYGFLAPAPTAEPLVGDVLARKDDAACPPLVHVHPDETVGAAIALLREYGVSQLPVVKARAAGDGRPRWWARSSSATCSTPLSPAAPVLDEPVGEHMSPPLPMVGSGEPVSAASVRALETGGAVAGASTAATPSGCSPGSDVLDLPGRSTTR